jgi:hypothetical protein
VQRHEALAERSFSTSVPNRRMYGMISSSDTGWSLKASHWWRAMSSRISSTEKSVTLRSAIRAPLPEAVSGW